MSVHNNNISKRKEILKRLSKRNALKKKFLIFELRKKKIKSMRPNIKRNVGRVIYKSFYYIGFAQLKQWRKFKATKKSYYKSRNLTFNKETYKKRRNRRIRILKRRRRWMRFKKRIITRNTRLQTKKRRRKLRRMQRRKRKVILERKARYSRGFRKLLRYKRKRRKYRYYYKRNIFYKLKRRLSKKLAIKPKRRQRRGYLNRRRNVVKLKGKNLKKFFKYKTNNVIKGFQKAYFAKTIKYIRIKNKHIKNRTIFALKAARIRKLIYRRYFVFHKRIKLLKRYRFKKRRLARFIFSLQNKLAIYKVSPTRKVKPYSKKRLKKRKRQIRKARKRLRKLMYSFYYLHLHFGLCRKNVKFNLKTRWWRKQIRKLKKRYDYFMKNKEFFKAKLSLLNKRLYDKFGRKFLLKTYNKRIKMKFRKNINLELQLQNTLLNQDIALYRKTVASLLYSDIQKFKIVKILLYGLVNEKYNVLFKIKGMYGENDIISVLGLNAKLTMAPAMGFLSNLNLKMITYMLKLKWYNKKLYRRLKERLLNKTSKYTYIKYVPNCVKRIYLPKIKYNFKKLHKYFAEFNELKYILKRKGKKTRNMYLMFNKLNEIYQYKIRKLGKRYYFMLRKDKLPKIGLFILNYLKRNMYMTFLNKKNKRVLGSTTARKNYLAKKKIEQEEELLKDTDSLTLSKDLLNLKFRAGKYIKKKKHRVNVLLNTLEAVRSHNYNVIDLCIKIKYKKKFLLNLLNFSTYKYKGFIRIVQIAHQKAHGYMRKKKARRL